MAGRGLKGDGDRTWEVTAPKRKKTAKRRRKTALKIRLYHELNHAKTDARLFSMKNRLCGVKIDGRMEVLLSPLA